MLADRLRVKKKHSFRINEQRAKKKRKTNLFWSLFKKVLDPRVKKNCSCSHQRLFGVSKNKMRISLFLVNLKAFRKAHHSYFRFFVRKSTLSVAIRGKYFSVCVFFYNLYFYFKSFSHEKKYFVSEGLLHFSKSISFKKKKLKSAINPNSPSPSRK